MNWGRAKTILIILFLALDVFLLVILLYSRLLSIYISADTVEKTAEILQEHQIKIQAENIPEKRMENQSLVMNNFLAEPETAAEKMLGGAFKIRLADEGRHSYVFENEAAMLSVKDGDFTYKIKQERKRKGKPTETTRESVEKLIINELQDMGFRKAVLTFVSEENAGGYFIYKAIPLYRDFEIHGITMYITADSLGILTITGNWFEAVAAESHEETLLDVTAVLTELIYLPEFQGVEIKQIKNGFLAYDAYVKSRRIAVIPVYVLVTETEEFYLDAGTGELIN